MRINKGLWCIMGKKKTKAEIIADNDAAGIERKQLPWASWCALRGFSLSNGRYLRKAGLAPKTVEVGRLLFVTNEADAAWFMTWTQGGSEKFKAWGREQRRLREERKGRSPA
jgi:hypothetical protein